MSPVRIATGFCRETASIKLRSIGNASHLQQSVHQKYMEHHRAFGVGNSLAPWTVMQQVCTPGTTSSNSHIVPWTFGTSLSSLLVSPSYLLSDALLSSTHYLASLIGRSATSLIKHVHANWLKPLPAPAARLLPPEDAKFKECSNPDAATFGGGKETWMQGPII